MRLTAGSSRPRFPVSGLRQAGSPLLAIGILLSASACRDAERRAAMAPVDDARVARAELALEAGGADDTVRVALRLTPGSGMARLGSVTAAVHFDTTRLAFVRDEASGGMRAAHRDGGVLRLAVAAPAGLDTTVARLRFVRRGAPSGASALSLTVVELHTMDGADVRPGLVIHPPLRLP